MDRRKDTWYTLLVGSLLAAVTQAAFWPVIHCAFLNYDGPDVQVRNGPRAVELAERACQLTEWKTAFFLGTLAAAYAEAGQFADAAATAERARNRAQPDKLEAVAKRNGELLELHRAGKPSHENVAALKR